MRSRAMLAAILVLITALFLFANQIAQAKSYGSSLCHTDQETQYSCHTVKRGETWEKLFPNSEKRDLVKRINRMNTQLYPGLKIAVPDSNDTDILKYSPLPTEIDPPGVKTVIVSMTHLAYGAYDANGTLKRWGPISGGKGYCSDVKRRCGTPTGKFAIYTKQGSGCRSTKYPVGKGGAPMPYCMFFHGGYALHGSYIVPGYHDSHGCVRMFVNDAQWLNQEFVNGYTTVVIKK